jgi:hypothetical protein
LKSIKKVLSVDRCFLFLIDSGQAIYSAAMPPFPSPTFQDLSTTASNQSGFYLNLRMTKAD